MGQCSSCKGTTGMADVEQPLPISCEKREGREAILSFSYSVSVSVWRTL